LVYLLQNWSSTIVIYSFSKFSFLAPPGGKKAEIWPFLANFGTFSALASSVLAKKSKFPKTVNNDCKGSLGQ